MPDPIPPVGWCLVGGSGFAAAAAGPAVFAATGSRLVAIVSRDRGRARAGLGRMRGFARAQRLGGSWLANKLRFSRPGRRLDALRRLGAFGFGPDRVRITDDLGRALDDPRVEAVWVASPPALHAAQALAALGRGKHVLCEKPLAVAPDEARAMIEAARRAGRTLAVGYQMRQHPAHRALYEECRAGAFGRLESFRATLHFRHPDPRPWHRSKAESGGWAVSEAGSHLVDLALWFLGDAAASVAADLSNTAYGFETDDRARITIACAGGAVAELDVSAGAEVPAQHFEIAGTEGRARCSETMFGQGGTRERAVGGGAPTVEAVAPVDLYRLQVEGFARALRGDPSAVVVPADEGLAGLEVIARARGW